MYKVVIVDDEPIIVEGLSKAIKWEKWNCEVAGSAGDGEEGLELIRSIQPDILFTDIRMPKIDGLGMIAGLRSEFPNMQISILTGFREFEYAKTALELGVRRYLIKPSKIAELEEAIGEMCRALSEKPLLSESEEDEKDKPVEADETQAAGSFIVDNAVEYIRNHYTEKLMLQDVADKVYVSQWHLSKLLNKHLNQNFSEILNGIRMEKAKELMLDPALRVSDIADMVGFLDLAHFSRVFHKITGMSPNEYRNQLGKKPR